MNTISILIMDDAPYVRHLIAAELSNLQGVKNIYEAGNPSIALHIIWAQAPEIIILDINVPSEIFKGVHYTNGIDVIRTVKQHLPTSAVVMLSNNSNEYYRRECKKAGADFFFDKTTEFDAFLVQVQQLIPDRGPRILEDKVEKPAVAG